MSQVYNIEIERYNGTDYDVLLPRPQNHADTHKSSGSDPLIITSDEIAENAVTNVITATIPSSQWIESQGDSEWWVNEFAVNGIKDTDRCIIDIQPTTSKRDAEVAYGWTLVDSVYCGNNKLTAYATDKPGKDIPIQILVIRK